MLFIHRFFSSFIAVAIICFSLISTMAFSAPKVSVSIKPLHSIVSAILADVQTPELIITNNISPHDYQLTPKDLLKIKTADILVVAGAGVDGQFIRTNSNALVFSIETIEDKLENLYELRSEHNHGDAHHESDHENHQEDPHFWLDTNNMKVFARQFSQLMIAEDPENQAIYSANLNLVLQKLDALTQEMKSTLEEQQTTPFLVFHDGYQYFDRQFNLNWQGSIIEQENQAISARHLFDLKQKIKNDEIQCIFVEPQFDQSKINKLVKDTAINTGELDAIGVNINAGKDLYFTLMRTLANNTKQCLQPST